MASAAPAGRPLRILQLYPKQDYFTGAAIQLCQCSTLAALVMASQPLV